MKNFIISNHDDDYGTAVAQKRAFTIADLYRRAQRVWRDIVARRQDNRLLMANKSDLKASKSSSDIYVMDADGKTSKQ